MRSNVPGLYSPKRLILTTRKVKETQLVWVEFKLGDQMGFQVQTAEETWSVEIKDEKCVQDILRRAMNGKQINFISHFNEEGQPTNHSRFLLPARLVRINLDHLGTASAALLLVLSGWGHRLDWDRVDLTQMRDTRASLPTSVGQAWSPLRWLLKR